jgi:ferredoxin-NADP reductase/MOSC domain-containing protein YiiM/ferredoxin
MNTLVSVNVGLPREVAWQGRTVRTAIWKAPADGRVQVTRLNLAGDRQADLAGHGGEHRAVMVYQLDSYRYWEKYLGRSDFVYGNFGENFTVEGLADDEVCIGDQFRIGSAIFEVSQPRVTCYRVGIRMNHTDLPALLVAHHRPGFYLRVIQEGEIGAGDRIEKIADGPEQMAVAEIDALLYSSHHPAEALRRAMRIRALSPGWQSSIKALLDAAEKGEDAGNAGLSATPTIPLIWRGFRPLKVIASNQESVDIRSYELAPVDGSRLPSPLPGQFILVRLRPSPDSPPVVRNYSLCGPPGAGTYTIAVKNEGGPASSFLHEHIRAGDLIEVGAPRGSFTLRSGAAPVVLVSGGVGITPALAMLHALASAGGLSREVWWFHSARDKAHDAYAGLVRTLIGNLQSGHLFTIYSRPSADSRVGLDYDIHGHLTVAVLERMGVPQTGDFYLCGPTGFLADVVEGLKAWSVEPSRIHTEVFGAATSLAPGVVDTPGGVPHEPTGPPGSGPSITFVRSGIAPRWDTRFHTLLELAEACSVPVRWSCRTGVCHTCETSVIDGRLRYSPDPLDPPPAGTALICCAIPTSDVILDL